MKMRKLYSPLLIAAFTAFAPVISSPPFGQTEAIGAVLSGSALPVSDSG
jgi:hypothetical protein